MTLLLDIRRPAWMREEDLRRRLAPALPGVAIRCGLDDGGLDDVTVLGVSRLHPGVAARLPGLRLVQKLGAGVETILTAPDLPRHVRIARLVSGTAAREIAEYCLAHVLAVQRNAAAHRADAAEGHWRSVRPGLSAATTVAVLGLGRIGAAVAALFARLGFRVLGWSRSARSLGGVDCRHGPAALPGVLAAADHVCAVLPSTRETRGLFDRALLAGMKPGATLVNVGRGDLIVDADLLAALDGGRPGRAVLDVFRQEPLPPEHPFWRHPQVTVTPHVSGWHIDDALGDVAENYRRLADGQPLLNEVDRTAGY